MLQVSVIGGKDSLQLISTLQNICCHCIADFKQYCSGDAFQILIVNDGSKSNLIELAIASLQENDILLINADDTCIYNYLKASKAKFITYGFNSKACITASSVVENDFKTIQICIQRSFKDFFGNEVYQQEFSVNIKNIETNIYAVLSSVACALVFGVQPSLIYLDQSILY